MHNLVKGLAGAVGALALLGGATSASALINGNIVITVDEQGNGTINGFGGPISLPSGLQNDPGPGGLANVLTYDLLNPPNLVAGDLLLFDANHTFSDVVRFNPGEVGPGGGTGSLVFYSDPLDGFDSKGDTFAPPGAYYGNTLSLTEVNGVVVYTPTAGEPGFVAGASAPVVWVLRSDVPEPGVWALLLLGLGAIGAALRGRAKAGRAAA